jgi:hypothetical protein
LKKPPEISVTTTTNAAARRLLMTLKMLLLPGALPEEEDFSPAEELLPGTRKRSSKVAAPTPNTIRGLPKKKKN